MPHQSFSPSRPESTGVNLLTFPAEILRSIFELLSPAEFRSMCLVCKAIRPHAEPLLYSRIDFAWLDKAPPITSLLRTILARPQLAAHIKSVTLGGHIRVEVTDNGSPYIRNYRFVKVPVTEEDSGPPIAFVESLKLSDDGFWVQELRAGTMDAYVAVLLSQLHNLRRLHMRGHFARETILLGTLFWSTLCEGVDRGLPDFRYLEEVSVVKEWSSYRNTQDLLPLFYLPALKHMKLWLDNPAYLNPDTMIAWPTGQVPNASTLRSLELISTREPQLWHILAATTGLQSLKWAWNHDKDTEDSVIKPVVDLDEIVRVLTPVKHTLTRLEIEAFTDLGAPPIQEPRLNFKGSLRSLREFIKLKSLHLPLEFLVAALSPDRAKPFAEFLPRFLEHLTVQTQLLCQDDYAWTGPTILDAVRPWLNIWRDYTPNLRVFHLMVDLDPWEWTDSMRDELIELGATAGLPIQVTESKELKRSRVRFANRQR
ncbi:hypothetical protein CONLIGDRAFT_146120 [Coniochaeta ligniaria NRRL 30616]|uniref:F-box domain-containing protein n=1 Tax=Coniochaeta ligniaria NRRL 30616 TaxID=1408157 RepID=A0A1J7IZH2_9PEZI|nr:hypothetical protein CONLIGDRAFT_146120 [Coniochaeta ligniaria NRRL 30616]